MNDTVRIESGSWEQLGEPASHIRQVVFVEEQNVPLDEEWDGLDPQCLHLLAWVETSEGEKARPDCCPMAISAVLLYSRKLEAWGSAPA